MKSIVIPSISYGIEADVYEGLNNSIILYFYGYSSSKERQVGLASEICKQTSSTIIIPEYSGHGTSEYKLDDISPAFNFLEVVAVFDWVKTEYPNSEISVIGGSYGGFFAAKLTKYRHFDKLVLRAPAIYRPADFYTKWENIDREWTRNVFRKDKKVLAEHPLLASASNFSGKTLVVVHENDNVVPLETTDAYIRAFGADVYVAKGFPHALSDPSAPKDQFENYQKNISDWLNLS